MKCVFMYYHSSVECERPERYQHILSFEVYIYAPPVILVYMYVKYKMRCSQTVVEVRIGIIRVVPISNAGNVAEAMGKTEFIVTAYVANSSESVREHRDKVTCTHTGGTQAHTHINAGERT